MRELTADIIRLLARMELRVAGAEEFVDWAKVETMAGAPGHYLGKMAEVGSLLDLPSTLSYFERALEEAGYTVPPVGEVLNAYARQLAEAILHGAIDQFQACGLISRIWLRLGKPESLASWGFLDDGLAADGQAQISAAEAQSEILRQARMLVAAPPQGEPIGG